MENENFDNQQVEQEAQPQAQTYPTNLADAFKMLKQDDNEQTQPTMEEVQSFGGAGQEEYKEDSGQSEPSATVPEAIETIDPTDNQSTDYAGGSPVAESEYDYDAIRKGLVDSVNQQAAQEANRIFRENGIKKMTINDLAERDTNTGRITFKNPDNPGKPFDSRQEAQAWIESFNHQVDTEWQNQAVKIRNQYVKDVMPAMNMIQFAPIFDSKDKTTQDVFDMIVEPYAVKDSSGKLVGFSCDLQAAMNQAESIVNKFGMQSKPAETASEVKPVKTGPALDMKTKQSESSATSSGEPKTIQEAMKMLQDQRRSKK